MKKILTISAIMIVSVMVLSGCNKQPKNKNENTSDSSGVQSCYKECEGFGGGDENIKMCKKNCDASFDTGSVWNEDQEKYNDDEVVSKIEWPSDMPVAVPLFTYGTVTGSVNGMGSWIVDFENVQDDALAKYKTDLETEGWSASIMSVTNMLTGKYESEYSISMSHDKEYKTLQIIIKKVN